MIQLRMNGLKVGSSLAVSDVSAGGTSASLAQLSFENPAPISGKPTISGTQAEGDPLTVDTSGFTVVGSINWLEFGTNSPIDIGSSLDTAGLGGTWVYAAFDSQAGLQMTAPIMVYAPGHMHHHFADDLTLLAAMPHSAVTHQAIANGNFSDAAIWHGGRVPGAGARVLVPQGRTVNYDVDRPYTRLDWVRVDGTVTRPLDRSVSMLVDTIFVSRGGEWICGDKDNTLPPEHKHTFVFSDRDYQTDAMQPTDIDLSRDTKLWTRGMVCQGRWSEWGAPKDHYVKAKEQSATFNGTYWDYVGMKAGDTDVKLERAPNGWSVGDTVIIPSTSIPNHGYNDPGPMASFTEEREITAINGDEITLDQPLTYDHDNQLSGSNRSDLFPHIMLKEARNISYEGECKDESTAWRRGHSVFMHHHAIPDLWYVQFLDMGRTDKRNNDGGVIDSNGDFHNVYENSIVQRVPLTARANLISRYHIHYHHNGKDNGKDRANRPIVHGCYAARSLGWLISHHGTDGDFVNCAMYEFAGSGMVGEDGSETGLWENNIAVKATTATPRIVAVPKVMQGTGGEYGDPFQWGYGFSMRGRLVRHVDNIAADCPWGHVFHHRGASPASSPNAMAYIERPVRDAQDLSSFNLYYESLVTDGMDRLLSNPTNYPLHLTQGNVSYSVIGGWQISKFGNVQNHFANTRLKDFQCWGVQNQAAYIEYIGQYVVDGFDLVGGECLSLGANVAQFSIRNLTAESNGRWGTMFTGTTTTSPYSPDGWDLNQPRWTAHGYHFKGTDNATYPGGFRYFQPGSKALSELAILNPDPKSNTLTPYDSVDPVLTLPKKCGVINMQNSAVSETLDNTSGKREDSISALNDVAPSLINDSTFVNDAYWLGKYMGRFGHNTYNDGTLKDVVVFRHLMSDQATGRPAKFSHWYEIQNLTNQSIGNQGEVFFSSTPVVRSDIHSVGAANAQQVIDITTGATGGNGSTYRLDTQDYIAPRHGFVTVDPDTGSITFDPDHGWTGTDEMFFFIESDNQWCTVRVDVLVGVDVTPAAPVGNTNFIAFDHANAGSLGIQPMEPPAIGDRAFHVTEYSTDAGSTWSRLCFGWKRDVYEITMASDDVTPIAAGSYTVQLRVRTDYDGSVSPASGDVSVTVT